MQWKVESEKLVAVNFDPFSRPRRQDRDDHYVENGMFYFANRKLIERGSFQSNKYVINMSSSSWNVSHKKSFIFNYQLLLFATQQTVRTSKLVGYPNHKTT